jgi:V/A-type H+-transporting ATPase subunit D
MTEKNIMSVHVPVYSFHTRLAEDGGILPYGFANTPSELDDSVREAGDLLSDLLELAAKEKAASLLAAEIEKTRRRVNALEHVLIPQTKENIKIISMKLAENDRANTTRLMKIKDMVLNQAHNYE